jgi:type I restriction enzyme S subunit
MHKLLPKGWSNKKLNDLGFVGRGKSKHRPRNDISLYGGDYPFIQTGEVKAADLYLNEYTQTYNEKGLSQSKLWEPETLCITIAANIAETAILKIKACFPDSIVGFVADPEKADVRFIKYYVDTIKLRMQNVSRGTTQDNLSLDKLLMFGFIVTPVPTQRKIASILSTYDDLIGNNTRRIKILEEMARMIYREWFVNFRFPGHEKVKMVDASVETHCNASLPNASLPNASLPRIPEGWELGRLQDFVELCYGKALKAEDRLDGPYPVYGSSGVVGRHSESLVDGPGIIVGRKGNVGSVHWTDEAFFPIDTVYYVKSDVSLYYVYYNLQQQNFINNDAAVPGLNRNQAYALPFLVPSKPQLKAFDEFIGPVFKIVRSLTKKNHNLRQTRDLLLPKLISGEVRV